MSTTTTTYIQTRVAQPSTNDPKPPIHVSLIHHTVNRMNANTPSIPSPIESAFYYYGLSSKPALIAWSSVNLWVQLMGSEAYLVVKELKPVGPYDLDQVWEPTVTSTIEAYLGSPQVEWTSLGPVCIRYAGGESFLVIGINDVHVEIHQSQTNLHVKLSKPVHTTKLTAQAIEPFATTLGQPICSVNTPNIEGMGGFIIDSKHPGELYLLTACHVLFHPDLTPNNPYIQHSTGQAAKKGFLLSDTALEDCIKAIQSEIGGKEILLMQLAARKQEVEGQDDDDTEEEREEVLHLEEEAWKAIAAMSSFVRSSATGALWPTALLAMLFCLHPSILVLGYTSILKIGL